VVLVAEAATTKLTTLLLRPKGFSVALYGSFKAVPLRKPLVKSLKHGVSCRYEDFESGHEDEMPMAAAIVEALRSKTSVRISASTFEPPNFV